MAHDIKQRRCGDNRGLAYDGVVVQLSHRLRWQLMIMIPSSTLVFGDRWLGCVRQLFYLSVLCGRRYLAWLSCKTSRRCLKRRTPWLLYFEVADRCGFTTWKPIIF